jgi:CspA family cold shock protein
VFVHITAVQRSGIPELSENMKISFEIQPDKKGRGPQAVDLQIV